MKTNINTLFLIAGCFLISCGNKHDQTSPAPIVAKVDVSNQYAFDVTGNALSGNYADSQWRAKNFTAEEMALFTSLDTADLSSTSYPGIITDVGFQFIYPNPFIDVFQTHKPLPTGFIGQVSLKLVIVDSMLRPQYKIAAMTGSSSSFQEIYPALPVGKYRLYYTLSAQSHPHFYKSWGNIQEL